MFYVSHMNLYHNIQRKPSTVRLRGANGWC